ncbi:MAG: flagellar hook assembly protein FlgD [Treponema sp.]|jgi:flagellar basal-body rod modification protein FlgD|nr:flagellar hook assembly protein FlgD [Treponema sp.]
MELQSVLNSQERARLEREVDLYNKTIQQGKAPTQNLGKDDFLKILITQLSHQDPTAPMEDKEFIGQMAQFSTLEQMTSMASDFSRLAEMLSGSEAAASLGHSVEIVEGDRIVQGTVKAVTRGGTPQVLVNGSYYQWDQVAKVFEE